MTTEVEDPLDVAIRALGKELSCPICLSILGYPVMKLACNHYFCECCVKESLKHQPKCPLCKQKANRRDLSNDEKMDRIVAAYAAAVMTIGKQDECDNMCSQIPLRAAQADVLGVQPPQSSAPPQARASPRLPRGTVLAPTTPGVGAIASNPAASPAPELAATPLAERGTEGRTSDGGNDADPDWAGLPAEPLPSQRG
eukprot:CAMPEP_0118948180 /NCGR_PEP_ID=MMETSP1169-20130426/47378_1 /TAXON_ID=36882 /ORGANISM="Pyramimonas obovata, Strain CCMP722" /LENGTH=197 /DNA_ID=CAMNT_0006894553 /DNA_START=146 /DNA_END=735 /DNA_ORIENTATION=+